MKKYQQKPSGWGVLVSCWLVGSSVGLGLPPPLGAAEFEERAYQAPPLAIVTWSDSEVTFAPLEAEVNVRLRVTGPDYVYEERSEGDGLVFQALEDDGGFLPDGVYRYELVELVQLDAAQEDALAQSRDAEEVQALKRQWRREGLWPPRIRGCSKPCFILKTGRSSCPSKTGGKTMRHRPHTQQASGSLFRRVSLLVLSGLLSWSGVGYGGGPVFTADVETHSSKPDLVLRDTDADAADWELEVDQAAEEAFSIRWTEGSGARPVVIEKGAPNNALYVDSLGRVGIGTAAPVQDLHLAALPGPRIRFEDTGSFPAIWDLSANSFGFFLSQGVKGTPFFIDDDAGDEAFHLDFRGRLGLGTDRPREAVDVVQDGASRFQLTSFSSSGADAAQFIQRRARGTEASPAAVITGDNLGLFSFRGMRPNGAFSGSQATITAQATQNWTNTARGTDLVFGTTQNGTSTVRSVMEITHDGRVLINGSQLNVPDYVFAEDYELMPLDELKAYISEHRHLPEVASEAEVKHGGVDLGGTQMALLKKIEQLTLYTLEQHEQLQGLQSQNALLQHQNTAFSQQLTKKNAALAQKDAELAQKDTELEHRLAALEHRWLDPESAHR